MQLIEEWEKSVNSYSQDYTEEYELFISGSSSRMLSGELATLLSGRYVQFPVYPFSYQEYAEIRHLEQNRESYMNTGGIPELFVLPEKQEVQRNYLSALKNTIIRFKQIIRYKRSFRHNRKPDVGREYPIKSLPTNDNFRHYKLGLQWGWNHNADRSKWSLTEHAGYLRLYTANVTDSLHKAKNTLTQRILGYPQDLEHSYGTVRMEIGEMQEGDVAGLAVFQDPYAFIGVKVIDGQKRLVYTTAPVVSSAAKSEQIGEVVTEQVIYLRAIANYNTSRASFYYSLDNKTYTKFGDDLNMKYDLTVFTGNKFAIFNYATVQTGGYVDVDWFTTTSIGLIISVLPVSMFFLS